MEARRRVLEAETKAGRAWCYRCAKPATTCVCGRIVSVDNQTLVTVLQHPRERFHPIGTVRFLALGLRRCRVVEGRPAVRGGTPLPFEPRQGAALLYPAPGARDLASLAPDERPGELVVLDGTWDQARTLYRDFPALHRLPHLVLTPPEPTRYRIRREPREDFVSTLEAVVHTLGWLEPQTGGLTGLLDAFGTMIDVQISHVARQAGRHHVRSPPRPEGLRGLPRFFEGEGQRWALAWAEWITGASGEPELMQLVGWRHPDGAVFESFAPGAARLPADQRSALGWPAALPVANSMAVVADAWRGFLGTGTPVGVWSKGVLRAVAGLTPGVRLFSLKAAYRSVRPGSRGGLEQVTFAESLRPGSPLGSGRAGRRLAAIVALALQLSAGPSSLSPLPG